MDMENIWIRLDINMRANGRTTCLMEGVRLFMLIKVDIMENSSIGRDMAREC
jgi:hypothetical protein